jgi:hypothetical protein
MKLRTIIPAAAALNPIKTKALFLDFYSDPFIKRFVTNPSTVRIIHAGAL